MEVGSIPAAPTKITDLHSKPQKVSNGKLLRDRTGDHGGAGGAPCAPSPESFAGRPGDEQRSKRCRSSLYCIPLSAKRWTRGAPVRNDPSDFKIKHEPGNPAANAAGDVKYPNVNPMIEMTDMRDAQRSYEANVNIIGATRSMIQRTLDILKG